MDVRPHHTRHSAFPLPSQTPSMTSRHMAKHSPWWHGQEAPIQTFIRMSRNVSEKKSWGGAGKESSDEVALFRKRSRLSWPKQLQSPQYRKTNGGKSQPGGFDPLKGLGDFINMQFCFFLWKMQTCFQMCVVWAHIHTRSELIRVGKHIKYQAALWAQCRRAQRHAVMHTSRILWKGGKIHKNIQLVASRLHC